MKKKLLIASLSSFLALSVCGVALILSNNNNVTRSVATGAFVTLNGTNYYQGSNQAITTSTGQYEIPFIYEDVNEGLEGYYHCQILEGGTLNHAGEIRYITSIHPDFVAEKGATLQARFSFDNSSWSDYITLSDDETYDLSIKPYFVEFTAVDNTVTINSLTINYSCTDNDDIDDDDDPFSKKITIYSTNDIHGQVYPDTSFSTKRMGLAKMMTYLKQEHDGNTLLLDQGDTWQGGLYSNMNYGNMINDMMCYVGYNARTVGNHDFDWKVDKLIDNTNREYNKYKIPVLAANVYDYDFDTKTVGTNQQSEIGGKSVTYTLDNGLKVGIVGVIGEDQITSINSLYMHDLTFIEHTNVIKEEATKLRAAGCDIVIGSIHGSQDQVMGHDLENYVDLMLCGHSHENETGHEGDLYYAQFGYYTEYLGKIELNYNLLTHKISTNIQAINYDNMEELVTTVDPIIDSLITSNYNKYKDEAERVLVKTVKSDFDTSYLAHIAADAIYEEAIKTYPVDMVILNNARKSLNGKTSWTFADIYESFPFDNEVYIFDVDAYDLVSLMNQKICWDPESDLLVEPGNTYKVAVLDFVAFRTDANRDYNYHSVASLDIASLPKLEKNYRELVRDYLLNHEYDKDGDEHELIHDDFGYNVPKFRDRAVPLKTYDVTLHYNDGRDGDDVWNVFQLRFNETLDRINHKGHPYTDGYDFDEWWLNPECTEPIDFEQYAYEVDVYASWIKQPVVTFYENDGTDYNWTVSMSNGDTIYGYAQSYYMERENYVFTGWYYDPDCTQPLGIHDFARDVSLYAGWKEAVTVRLHTDYGQPENYYEYSVALNEPMINYLPNDTEQNYGLTFIGWFYDEDCTQPLAVDDLGRSIDLYAGYNHVNCYLFNCEISSLQIGVTNVTGFEKYDEVNTFNTSVILNVGESDYPALTGEVSFAITIPEGYRLLDVWVCLSTDELWIYPNTTGGWSFDLMQDEEYGGYAYEFMDIDPDLETYELCFNNDCSAVIYAVEFCLVQK